MRKILFTVLAFLAVGAASADEKTLYLKTDTQVVIPVDNVDYLVAADDDDLFTVVVKNGQPVANVTSVKVVDSATGIETVDGGETKNVVLPTKASNSLQLSGLRAGTRVDIYSADGKLVKNITSTGGELTIGVADLAAGTYVMKTKDSEVKFVKQ